jgi:hypothetical protein
MKPSDSQDLEVLDFIESSLKEIDSLKVKLAEVEKDRVILEKVAGSSSFEDDKIDDAIEKLAESRLLDPLQAPKVSAIIKEDPKKLLELMSKVAEYNMALSNGRSFQREDNEQSESDPDGWSELINRY